MLGAEDDRRVRRDDVKPKRVATRTAAWMDHRIADCVPLSEAHNHTTHGLSDSRLDSTAGPALGGRQLIGARLPF
jgi:hypothetical protein